MIAARLAALERYTPEALPTGQEEEWRRFPLADLPRIAGAAESAARHEGAPSGVVLAELADAARDDPGLVHGWLGAGEGMRSHAAFGALAGALWSAGSFVHVPAGADVAAPLRIARRWAAGTDAAISRTIVVAERGSRVTLVEELASDGGGPGRVAIPLLEAHVGEGASLTYVGIQRYGDDAWHLGVQRYVSARDSTLRSFNVEVGSRRTKLGVESDIRGDGAGVKLYGLVAAGDEQRIDVNSLQRVDGKASQSDLLYLSALYGAAKAVYYGVIRVEPTSSGTGSYQECRNLLLSDKAGADPIPVLEILTNDVVRCGHGATVGPIQEAELFYVMSRGLSRTAAEQLLVRGFFQRVIANLPSAQIRGGILDALEPRIGRVEEVDR